MEGEKERQGDFVFTATEVGEYRFCFDNSVSTFSDKVVDFEITVRTSLVISRFVRVLILIFTGRKRSPSLSSSESRCLNRAT